MLAGRPWPGRAGALVLICGLLSAVLLLLQTGGRALLMRVGRGPRRQLMAGPDGPYNTSEQPRRGGGKPVPIDPTPSAWLSSRPRPECRKAASLVGRRPSVATASNIRSVLLAARYCRSAGRAVRRRCHDRGRAGVLLLILLQLLLLLPR